MHNEVFAISEKISSPVARRIWGNPDTILLFFAGGSAEFAAIKAVDWLFYTNKLPSSPISRFFDTMVFAQKVFFGTIPRSGKAVDMINRIHTGVEKSRGKQIPQWAYKDMLFMILDYGERAHEVVFGPLSAPDKQSYFEAVLALGHAMHLQELPQTYEEYQVQRKRHLHDDYALSPLTLQLFEGYKNALGPIRFFLLKLVQASLIPAEIGQVLQMKPNLLTKTLLRLYRYLPGGGNKLWWLQDIILPGQYAAQLRNLANIAHTQ